MSVLGVIKTKIGAVKKKRVQAERARIRRQNEIIKKRNKHLPGIKRLAKKFHARVEVLDTAAFVYKNLGRREVGVHITYGLSEADVRRKLESAFTPSATSSKIIRGISAGARKIKAVKKDLGRARKDLHEALGGGKNMWEDPNFGKRM